MFISVPCSFYSSYDFDCDYGNVSEKYDNESDSK